MAMATMAIQESQKIPPRKWDPHKLDNILQKGDNMYMSIVEKSPQLGYLTFNDISSALTDTDVSESLHGTLDYCNSNSSSPFLSLKDAFNELLAVNGQCLFTMGNSVPCYTTAVMRDENQYYLFDSHSRGDMGLLKPDGAACLTVHQNIDELCIFVRDLAASLKLQDPVPFELASILTQQYSSDCDSNFGGFAQGHDLYKLNVWNIYFTHCTCNTIIYFFS